MEGNGGSAAGIAGVELGEAAWAVRHSRNTCLSAPYRRLAGRRGRKRAIVAVGHAMLVMVYHMLREDVD